MINSAMTKPIIKALRKIKEPVKTVKPERTIKFQKVSKMLNDKRRMMTDGGYMKI